jgi:hypothetical protein
LSRQCNKCAQNKAEWNSKVPKRSAAQLLSVRHFTGSMPQAIGTSQKAEGAKWWPMIKAANVKVD